MRTLLIPTLLAVVSTLSACKQQEVSSEARPVRTVVAHATPLADDRQAVGEVKPRYESELSFRVAGKVMARLVDVGASVKQGDTLARLDKQDYENRLRAAEAEVASAEAALVEAQSTEARQSKLLNDGWTPKANYDSALRNLRSTQARLNSAKANLALARDQLRYTDLKADFDGVITAVGAETGQNVSEGQMIVKLARPDVKDGVFNVAETVFARHGDGKPEVLVWPLSNPDLKVEGQVREISPIADAATRTYTVKVTLKNPPPQLRLGMSLAGRVKTTASSAVELPLSALFEKGGRPAVWLFNPSSGEVSLRLISIARYDINSVIVGGGLSDGDLVVTAGINTLREGERVRLATTSPSGSDVK